MVRYEEKDEKWLFFQLLRLGFVVYYLDDDIKTLFILTKNVCDEMHIAGLRHPPASTQGYGLKMEVS